MLNQKWADRSFIFCWLFALQEKKVAVAAANFCLSSVEAVVEEKLFFRGICRRRFVEVPLVEKVDYNDERGADEHHQRFAYSRTTETALS